MLQALQDFLSFARFFIFSWESSPVQLLMSFNHILLGLPWDSLEFNLPSSTSSQSFPLDPRKTWPAKAIFCFLHTVIQTQFFSFYSLEYFFVRNFVCPFNFHHSAIAPLLEGVDVTWQVIIQSPAFTSISCDWIDNRHNSSAFVSSSVDWCYLSTVLCASKMHPLPCWFLSWCPFRTCHDLS